MGGTGVNGALLNRDGVRNCWIEDCGGNVGMTSRKMLMGSGPERHFVGQRSRSSAETEVVIVGLKSREGLFGRGQLFTPHTFRSFDCEKIRPTLLLY